MSRAQLEAQFNDLQRAHDQLRLRYAGLEEAHQQLLRKEAFLERQLLAMTMLTRSKTLANGNLHTALQEITRQSARTLEIDHVGVWLFSADHTELRCIEIFDGGKNDASQVEVLDASHFPAYVAEINKDQVVDASDAMSDPRTAQLLESYLKPHNIVSMLDVPIRARGELLGVLCHEHHLRREWALQEIHFASFAASLVTLALESRDRIVAQENLRRLGSAS
jgi:two-component system, sensor histidine kinase and response regulator